MKKYKSIGSHIATEQSCSTGLPLCVPMVFNMEKEIWKNVIGYSNYKISNLGRLINNNGHEQKPQRTKNGYYRISLSKNCIQTKYLLHRLIAIHFILNPENKPTVNHIDGKKYNNIYTNLEWCTKSENIIHAFKLKLRTKPYNLNNKKEVVSVIDNRVWESARQCSVENNISYHKLIIQLNNTNVNNTIFKYSSKI
jgi:hypothetical protein